MKNITVQTSTSPLSSSLFHHQTQKNSSKALSSSYLHGVIPEHESNPRLNTSFSGNVQLPPVAELHQRRQHIQTAGGVRKASVPSYDKYQGMFGSLVGYNLGMQSNPSLRQESEYSYIDDKLALAKTYLGNGSSANLPASTRAGTNISPFRNGSRLLGSECQSKKWSNNQIGRENFSWMGSTSELGDFHQILEDRVRSKSRKPALISQKKKRHVSKEHSLNPAQIVSATKRRKVIIDSKQKRAGTLYDPVVEKRPRLKKKLKSNRTPKYSSITTQREYQEHMKNMHSQNASLLPTSPDYLRETEFSPFKEASLISTQRQQNDKSPSRGQFNQMPWMNQESSIKLNQTADLHSNRVIMGTDKEEYPPINPFQLPVKVKQFKKLLPHRRKEKTPTNRSLSSRLKLHKLTHKTSVMSQLSDVYDTGRSNSHKSSKYERNAQTGSGHQPHSFVISNLLSPLNTGGPRLVIGSDRVFSTPSNTSTKRAHFLRQAKMSEEEMKCLTDEEREEIQRQQKKLFLLRERELEQADKKVREVMTDHLHLQRDLATYESYVCQAIGGEHFVRDLEQEMVELIKPIVGPLDELHEVSMLKEGAILEVDHEQVAEIRDSKTEQNVAAGFQLLRELSSQPAISNQSMIKAFELNLSEMQSMKRVQTDVSGVFTCIELLESKVALRISSGLKIESSVIQIPPSFRAMSIGKLLSHLEYLVITAQSEFEVRAGFIEHQDKNTKRLNCLVWLPFNLHESKESRHFSFTRERASSIRSEEESGTFEQIEFQSHLKRENGSCSIQVKEEVDEEEEEEFHSQVKEAVKNEEWSLASECVDSSFLCKAEACIPRYDETETYSEKEVEVRITVGWSKDFAKEKTVEFTTSIGEELIRSYGTSNSKFAECLSDHIPLSKFLQY